MARVVLFLVFALGFTGVGAADNFEVWLQKQTVISRHNLLKNISPTGTPTGTVIAAPSRSNPDYYYHWVRDAALVMNATIDLYETEKYSKTKSTLNSELEGFVDLTLHHQVTPTLSGLGEPKFYVDGRGYDQAWGRPQNDGPALRAITLIRYARIRLQQGDREYVQTKLYDSALPSSSAIKRDLEYVAHNWRAANFDLWEEVFGDHYYTRMAQAKSLELGSELANDLGDSSAASFYAKQAKKIRQSVSAHIDPTTGLIRENLIHHDPERKSSGLDAATVLAHLHTREPLNNDVLLATAAAIEDAFVEIYAVNHGKATDGLGAAIGRYPEDVYYGGNPWFLTTLAFAEFHFKLAEELSHTTISVNNTNATFLCELVDCYLLRPSALVMRRGSALHSQLISKLNEKGDRYIKRVRKHLPSSGSMSEQYDRWNGYIKAAPDLTWSYASFLTAVRARQ